MAQMQNALEDVATEDNPPPKKKWTPSRARSDPTPVSNTVPALREEQIQERLNDDILRAQASKIANREQALQLKVFPQAFKDLRDENEALREEVANLRAQLPSSRWLKLRAKRFDQLFEYLRDLDEDFNENDIWDFFVDQLGVISHFGEEDGFAENQVGAENIILWCYANEGENEGKRVRAIFEEEDQYGDVFGHLFE